MSPISRVCFAGECKQNDEYIIRVPSSFDFVRGKWNKKYSSLYFEDENFFFVPIWSISKNNYTGEVYNFEVEGDHTYTANFAAVGNCQNFSISQASLNDLTLREMAPEEASEISLSEGCRGIAFTYNEPTIWHEFAFDASKIAKEKGLSTIYVTNGFIEEEPLRELSCCLDAMNIDVKGFTDDFYSEVCKAPLGPVLRATELAHKLGIHIELTYLIIPGKNDGEEEMKRFVDWVAGSLDPKIPVHFTRFHPDYLMKDMFHPHRSRPWNLLRRSAERPVSSSYTLEMSPFHMLKILYVRTVGRSL